jgi:hypothetical protein
MPKQLTGYAAHITELPYLFQKAVCDDCRLKLKWEVAFYSDVKYLYYALCCNKQYALEVETVKLTTTEVEE